MNFYCNVTDNLFFFVFTYVIMAEMVDFFYVYVIRSPAGNLLKLERVMVTCESATDRYTLDLIMPASKN